MSEGVVRTEVCWSKISSVASDERDARSNTTCLEFALLLGLYDLFLGLKIFLPWFLHYDKRFLVF